jgi:hypothetical protein
LELDCLPPIQDLLEMQAGNQVGLQQANAKTLKILTTKRFDGFLGFKASKQVSPT